MCIFREKISCPDKVGYRATRGGADPFVSSCDLGQLSNASTDRCLPLPIDLLGISSLWRNTMRFERSASPFNRCRLSKTGMPTREAGEEREGGRGKRGTGDKFKFHWIIQYTEEDRLKYKQTLSRSSSLRDFQQRGFPFGPCLRIINIYRRGNLPATESYDRGSSATFPIRGWWSWITPIYHGSESRSRDSRSPGCARDDKAVCLRNSAAFRLTLGWCAAAPGPGSIGQRAKETFHGFVLISRER